jgi:hypothetical protein
VRHITNQRSGALEGAKRRPQLARKDQRGTGVCGRIGVMDSALRICDAASMVFFEQVPDVPQPEPPVHYRLPEWLGPPEHVAPGVVPLELVLVNTGEIAVYVSDARAYPNGFACTVLIAARDPLSGAGPIHHPGMHAGHAAGATDGVFRFGVQFSDGAKATNMGRVAGHLPMGRPDGPVLMPRGGGGGGASYQQGFWVWPMPPAGDLVFACEWPDRDIDLRTATVEARLFHEAAQRSVELWQPIELPEPPWASPPTLPG